jgi:hypothetical protein
MIHVIYSVSVVGVRLERGKRVIQKDPLSEKCVGESQITVTVQEEGHGLSQVIGVYLEELMID